MQSFASTDQALNGALREQTINTLSKPLRTSATLIQAFYISGINMRGIKFWMTILKVTYFSYDFMHFKQSLKWRWIAKEGFCKSRRTWINLIWFSKHGIMDIYCVQNYQWCNAVSLLMTSSIFALLCYTVFANRYINNMQNVTPKKVKCLPSYIKVIL